MNFLAKLRVRATSGATPVVLAIIATILNPIHANASGIWIPLTNLAPDGVELMLLLPNGNVMVADEPGGDTFSADWFLLTPDYTGSYANGTWSFLSSMNDTRYDFASAVLTNGQVWVAGGEYGTGYAASEVYDPPSDTWTQVSIPTSLLDPAANSPEVGETQGFSDAPSVVLPNGTVLVAPVAAHNVGGTLIFNPTTMSFTDGPLFSRRGYPDQAEASWVKLPDDSILTIDPTNRTTERYIPSQARWIPDSSTTVSLYTNFEIGPAFLLPNGKAIFFGATGHTAIYTPSGNTNPGTWAAGPDLPNHMVTADAPGVMMSNGKILCQVAAVPGGSGPSYFYEYDWVSNAFTSVSAPYGPNYYAAPYYNKMLDLPDGTVLFSTGGNPQVYVYQPDGAPAAGGKPSISNITFNATTSSYHLTGTLLNGISQGAAYGDDAQMDSNYPLVRLTDSGGNVYYAQTYGWNSTSVMATNRLVTTEFTLPAGLQPGTYSLVAVANGIASDPLALQLPLQLSITQLPSGNGIVLTWPAVPSNLALQQTADVTSGIWMTVTNTPAGVGGNLVLTNSTVGNSAFFRLQIN